MDSTATVTVQLTQLERRLSPAEIARVLGQLGRALLHSRLLLIYLLLGAASGAASGRMGLVQALVNYLILLPLYVSVIYLWTRHEPPKAISNGVRMAGGAARSPWDLVLVVVLFLANLGVTLWFWAGGPPSQVMDSVGSALRSAGWDRNLANAASNGVASTLFTLVPALLLALLLFRLRPGQVGLVPRYLGLGLALIALGIGLALLVKIVYGITPTPLLRGAESAPFALALFCTQLFINGLPEEFIFRGVILSRVLPWLRNPHHALVLTSVLFVAMHIPSHLAQPTGAPWWTLVPLGAGLQPTGLIWSYLFYRTRSIWPGVLWHTSFLTLGVIFLG